ncbi:hypothetical protein [Hymenobacter cellulosilyticus]|uniref:Uncharacterized protein n=1 Tax=Hymenobacter cellulosilyticus TaxID=2932248 RepID=A0A8T9Q659_9BACT|nr:hypothetical protein [Hymenobacter cellulosilyticus]UOQ73037.1 hypothetical protein MUN79_03410 [Hymenobacter cellulosilyticus]
MIVVFVNNCVADSSFSIQWNGGQSNRTAVIQYGQSVSIDTSTVNIPNGTSCWARAYVQTGPNHDSSDNFTFPTNEVTYTLTGGVDDPEFSCSGCN